jgi:MFS family permease
MSEAGGGTAWERSGNARWWVPIALMVSLFVAFLDRLNMGYALPVMAEDFGWDDKEVGQYGQWMLGAFFISYGASNILFTPLAARFGARRSLMTIVVLFSLFTALGAPAAGFGFGAFLLTRVLLGLGEGVHFPMMSTVTKHWFPVHERSRANGIWIAGGMLATICAAPLLVPIIHTLGWKAMLIITGFLGMVITLPFLYVFVHNTPRESPRVSAKEADYIEGGLEKDTPVKAGDWSFLSSPLFYFALSGAALNNYCVYGITTWLPTYFTRGKGIPFEDLWYAASLPYVVGVLSIVVFSHLGDRLNRRIVTASAGFALAAVGLWIATRAPNLPLLVAGFSMATFFQMSYVSQEFAIIQRLLPANVIGKAIGIYNGMAMFLGGVGGSMLPGTILGATGSYDAAMYSIMGAMVLGSAGMFCLSRFVKY